MKSRVSLVAVLPFLLALPAFGQIGLVNGDFALPGEPLDRACPTGGLHGAPDNWIEDTTFSDGAYLERNGSVHIPVCPRDVGPTDEDNTYAYWSTDASQQQMRYYQTITLPAPTNGTDTYKFSGYYAGGVGASVNTLKFGIVASHTLPPTITGNNVTGIEARKRVYMLDATSWTLFTQTLKPAAGYEYLTVYFQAETGGSGFNAVWWDTFTFNNETLCPNQPDIESISPTMGQRGDTVTIDLTGVNFASAPTPTVTLTGPQTIAATTVTWVSSTLVQAAFDLPADAKNGKYSVEYVQGDCSPVTVPLAFEVYLEALQNGSFELQPAATACAPEPWGSDYWLFYLIGTSGWPNGMVKNGWVNGTLPFVPTCPLDGSENYGTLSSTLNGGQAVLYYQVLAAQPEKQYVFSGKFAASGDIESAVRIYEGPLGGTLLSDHRVADNPAEPFDWRTDFVTGTTGASAETITVAWMANVAGPSPTKAVHADLLKVEVCESPVTLSAMAPGVASNAGPFSNAIVTGEGFSGTPVLQLRSGSTSVTASSVTVDSPTQITCSFPLTGAQTGDYELLIIQGTCMARLDNALKVGAPAFVNGSFELPAEADPQDPCNGPISGVPTGWRSSPSGALQRDAQAPAPPACPNPVDGGHYASFSSTVGGTYKAWQTLIVSPGTLYKFSGEFTAPDGVTMKLLLLDGTENGTELISTTVSNASLAWVPAIIEQAAPSSGIMTAVWQLEFDGTAPNVGGHADGLRFELACEDPFADFDADTDVDQLDFAFFQACYTGGTPPGQGNPALYPAECRCADPNRDGAIEQGDLFAFEACASGPGIAADANCD